MMDIIQTFREELKETPNVFYVDEDYLDSYRVLSVAEDGYDLVGECNGKALLQSSKIFDVVFGFCGQPWGIRHYLTKDKTLAEKIKNELTKYPLICDVEGVGDAELIYCELDEDIKQGVE